MYNKISGSIVIIFKLDSLQHDIFSVKYIYLFIYELQITSRISNVNYDLLQLYKHTSVEKLVRIHKYVYSASVFTLGSNKEMILQEPMTKCRVTDTQFYFTEVREEISLNRTKYQIAIVHKLRRGGALCNSGHGYHHTRSATSLLLWKMLLLYIYLYRRSARYTIYDQ